MVMMVKFKSKSHSRTGREALEGEHRYRCTLSLTSALNGVGRQLHAPGNKPVPIA